MNKKVILLLTFYVGCLFGLNTEGLCPDPDDPFSDNPFKFPKSIFLNHQLTEAFLNPQSNLDVDKLTESFVKPFSNLQDRDLSNSFINPDSQFLDQQFSNLTNLNILSASILDCKDDYSFWIGVHCDNINSIAGFQFELPDNLELLDIEGVRSADSDFQIHNNDNGLILGFSMSGDSIPALSYNSNTDESLIIKLHVKADSESIFSFPIKSILAGPKGEKLSFKNLNDVLSFKNQSIIISFIE